MSDVLPRVPPIRSVHTHTCCFSSAIPQSSASQAAHIVLSINKYVYRICKIKNQKTYICIYTIIYNGWSKFLYPGTAILRKQIFRESFANSMFIFRGIHVEQQFLLWDSSTTCQVTQNYRG
jgi:hypothetical protein